MVAPPFLTFPVRGKRGIVRARQCARQVAALLHYPVPEQACIAAGAFAIACQARAAYGKFVLCFQMEAGQFHVYARPGKEEENSTRPHNRLAGLAGEGVLRLAKALPSERTLSEADVAWLIGLSVDTKTGVFEEIVRQNQEVLALLHELQALKKPGIPSPAAHPHAA